MRHFDRLSDRRLLTSVRSYSDFTDWTLLIVKLITQTSLVCVRQVMSNREGNNTLKSDEVRPKPVFFWNNTDVMKWLKRHCGEYYDLYYQQFVDHEITGRSLVRMSDVTLQRMGITDANHREDICRIVFKLKLKSDILEMKDLEKKIDYASTLRG